MEWFQLRQLNLLDRIGRYLLRLVGFARRRSYGSVMLWPLMVQLECLFGVAVRERFHEVRIQGAAMRTWNYMTVVAEEVETLLGMQYWLEARVTLERNMFILTMFSLTAIRFEERNRAKWIKELLSECTGCGRTK